MKLSTRYRLSYSVIPVLPRKAVRYILFSGFSENVPIAGEPLPDALARTTMYIILAQPTRTVPGQPAPCTQSSMNGWRLLILFAVQHQVHLAVSYSEIVTQINSAPIKKSQSYRLDDLIAAKERELTKITRYKQSLYQDWKDGEITQQEYRDMKADYERQTSDISAVLTRLNAERAELANGVDNEHPALVAFMKYQNIEALNREILVELVDYIKVYENGNISVKFKFADELRKIAEYIEINTTEDTAVAG